MVAFLVGFWWFQWVFGRSAAGVVSWVEIVFELSLGCSEYMNETHRFLEVFPEVAWS